MRGRIVKSERILTKLRVLDYEYICDRMAKFHKKILFITRVINIQILGDKIPKKYQNTKLDDKIFQFPI